MKRLTCVLLFLFLFHFLDPRVTPATSAVSLTCTIRGPATFPWGSSPHFDVEIRNQTGRDILLVGSLDGSDVRLRYPYCYFEVFDSSGRSTVAHPGRCGNSSPIRENDFVRVPKAGSFDPFLSERGFHYPYYMNAATFPAPGEYRVRFVYSTEGEQLGAWMNKWYEGGGTFQTLIEDKDLLALLAQVPKTRVVSNEVRIRITEKPK